MSNLVYFKIFLCNFKTQELEPGSFLILFFCFLQWLPNKVSRMISNPFQIFISAISLKRQEGRTDVPEVNHYKGGIGFPAGPGQNSNSYMWPGGVFTYIMDLFVQRLHMVCRRSGGSHSHAPVLSQLSSEKTFPPDLSCKPSKCLTLFCLLFSTPWPCSLPSLCCPSSLETLKTDVTFPFSFPVVLFVSRCWRKVGQNKQAEGERPASRTFAHRPSRPAQHAETWRDPPQPGNKGGSDQSGGKGPEEG